MLTIEEKRARKAAYMREYTKRTGCQKADYSDPEKLERQREKWKAANARWRAKNPDKHRAFAKRYAQQNPEKVKAANHAHHLRTLKQQRVYRAKYRDQNRDHIRKYMREYQARRRDTDENHRLRCVLRGRIWSALNRRKSTRHLKRTTDLIGCDIPFLKGFMEARFLPGMTWANMGKWHVDHHVPLAEFDLRDPVQQKQAFNYSNLRPLWGVDNLSKGAKCPPTHQAELL